MKPEEKAELLANCKNDGPWRRTAVLFLNFATKALEPVSIWDETALCANCQAMSATLSDDENRLVWMKTEEGPPTDQSDRSSAKSVRSVLSGIQSGTEGYWTRSSIQNNDRRAADAGRRA